MPTSYMKDEPLLVHMYAIEAVDRGKYYVLIDAQVLEVPPPPPLTRHVMVQVKGTFTKPQCSSRLRTDRGGPSACRNGSTDSRRHVC
jgi:hypothetical protein